MVLFKIGPSMLGKRVNYNEFFPGAISTVSYKLSIIKVYAKSDGDIFLNPPGDR